MAVMAEDAQLDMVFMALSDPTRRDILARLATGEATVKELAAPYDMSFQAVSQHIGVLERSGLVHRRQHRQTRPCRLNPASLAAAAQWLDDSQRLWADRLDQLEGHLARLPEQGRP